MRATFVSRGWDNEARTIGSFYFKPEGRYTFTAGQYADITIPHDRPDTRGLTRTMTFSSSPNDKLLRITTRLGPGPVSTYKQALLGMKPGFEIAVTDSMGDMILPLDSSIPLVFVAGGVGIASYASILQWLTEEKEAREITVLYSVRQTIDVIFHKLIRRYAAFHPLTTVLYTPAVNRDVNAPHAFEEAITHERLKAADIVRHVKPNSQIYLSGSAEMVEQLRRDLQGTHGIPQYRIAFDYFDGYSASEI